MDSDLLAAYTYLFEGEVHYLYAGHPHEKVDFIKYVKSVVSDVEFLDHIEEDGIIEVKFNNDEDKYIFMFNFTVLTGQALNNPTRSMWWK
jgi:hypothetical protein